MQITICAWSKHYHFKLLHQLNFYSCFEREMCTFKSTLLIWFGWEKAPQGYCPRINKEAYLNKTQEKKCSLGTIWNSSWWTQTNSNRATGFEPGRDSNKEFVKEAQYIPLTLFLWLIGLSLGICHPLAIAYVEEFVGIGNRK